jgi:hypothetical protein
MGEELERRVSMEEIEAEEAQSLPNKEVMSLLDVNANVDLGLDLAAPVDLAVAANLNVAAPIEASASANLLSPEAQAVSLAQQHGSIDQGISGEANATAPQHAEVTQNSNPVETGQPIPGTPAPVDGQPVETTAAPDAATPVVEGADATTPVVDGATSDAGGVVDGATGAVGGVVDGATGAVDGATGGVGGAVDGAGGAVGGAVDGAGGAVDGAGGAVQGVTGGVNSLLNGGSLLDANVNVHANADLAAPIDGAVAANGNVAAPIDAAVSANIASDHAVAEALAPQEVNIHQSLDDVQANATATQDAGVDQQ